MGEAGAAGRARLGSRATGGAQRLMRMQQPIRTIYLECTSTYRFDHRTGIPRVVRNLVRHFRRLAPSYGFAVVPVQFADGAFHRVPLGEDERFVSVTQDGTGELGRSRGRRILDTLAKFAPGGALRSALLAPSTQPGVAALVRHVSAKAARFVPRARRERADAVEIGACDVLFHVDLTMAVDMRDAHARLRANGTFVCAIVYDLIPLQHPDIWPPGFVDHFRNWIVATIASSDRIFTISRAVESDVERYRAGLPAGSFPEGQAIEWFHLGYDMDLAEDNEAPRAALREIFESPTPVLLNVGWFDPRKNQGRLVEALGRLHARGVAATLLLVGKRGIGAEPVFEALRAHPQLAASVLFFHDLSDAELLFAFRHSRALVYSSYAEGFGLPLVEALMLGLPALVSDIPVFREIADGHAVYFDPFSVDSIAATVEAFLVHGDYPAANASQPFAWMSWEESAQRLFGMLTRALPGP
jgi:glycosyltransferase involved in cell wall biosynthesis